MPIASGIPQPKDLFQLNRQILSAIIKEYPLRAYVVDVENGQAMINLGSNQGVVVGTKFNAIGETKEIEYKGKKLKSAPEVIGQIEVVKTEPDLAYCRVLNQKRWIEKDDKLIENPEEITQ
jgi:hypothetical protein